MNTPKYIKHYATGKVKRIYPVDSPISWTSLFFNVWPALFRGDFYHFFIFSAIGFIAGLILGLLFGDIGTLLSFGFQVCMNIYLCVKYNELHRNRLYYLGYRDIKDEQQS